MESYRQVVVKGKNATVTSLIDQRFRIMQPEKAKTVEEVEAKLTQWRSDIRILRESRQRQDLEMLSNDDQMIRECIGQHTDEYRDHLIIVTKHFKVLTLS